MGTQTLVLATTAEDVAHQPGTVVQLADGRTRTVRGAMFGASTVTLLFEEGPSDTYRRSYVLDVIDADED